MQPRACGEELVDQEGVAKSAALEHGGVHGLEVLERAACLKQGGECWECLEGGGGEEDGNGLPRLDDHLLFVVTWLTNNDCSNRGYLFIYLFISGMLQELQHITMDVNKKKERININLLFTKIDK